MQRPAGRGRSVRYPVSSVVTARVRPGQMTPAPIEAGLARTLLVPLTGGDGRRGDDDDDRRRSK
jgi:hypothetical protein